MTLILAMLLASAVQEEDPELTDMPEEWVTGKRSGWDGDYPPGWEKKTDKEKAEFLKQWNAAKFKYIKFMQGVKGNPTPPVTGERFMFKAVNGGVRIPQALELAKFGMTQKLKEPDFKCMMKGSCVMYGTDVPHGEAVNIVKDLVQAGLRGLALEKRIGTEIKAKDAAMKADKAKKEQEKDKDKPADDKDKK